MKEAATRTSSHGVRALTGRLVGAGATAAGLMVAMAAWSAPLAVEIHEGQAHASVAALERDAGIAIKRLGPDAFVACAADRCVSLPGYTEANAGRGVPLEPLARALGATLHFVDGGRQATFELGAERPGTPQARVGSLAPNFRLTRLDGREIAFEEFRGRRVLINSWASW